MNHNPSTVRVILGLGLCLGLGVVVAGCKKRGPTSSLSPAPTATTVPATNPATRPTAALWIDGASYRFPPATLVLSPQGDGLSATLCSDDPPAALNSNYHGNSFMIQMKLDVTTADELDGYVWKTVADPSADVDSNTGVFLNGTARELQPTSLSVSFHKRGDDLIADVDGLFQSLDSGLPSARNRSAVVNGRLYTQVINRP